MPCLTEGMMMRTWCAYGSLWLIETTFVHHVATLHPAAAHHSHHSAATTPTHHPQISTLAALAYHKATGREAARPHQRLGFAENFLYMLDSNGNTEYRPNPQLARALEIMFILHQVCVELECGVK